MGGNASAQPKQPLVDRSGLDESEYEALRKALRVESEAGAVVELGDFLACFPAQMRPLVQPVFCQLGGVGIGATSVAWQPLVSGVSSLARMGTSWQALLSAWDGDELDVHVELAASLCFWCAYPRGAEAELERFLAAMKLKDVKGLQAALPHLPSVVGQHFAVALMGAKEVPLPRLEGESKVLDAACLLLLAASDARLWGAEAYEPLYRNWKDGESFSALLKGALHYSGPALLVIKTAEGQVIGALSTCWEDYNGKFAANSSADSCFLFSVLPAFQLMRSSRHGGNHVYLNARNSHERKGIGFGGQPGFFRLWLDADLEECYALESDATFSEGRLIPDGGMQAKFKVSALEVWGAGGAEAREEQRRLKQSSEGVREAARRVDRAKMLENDFDKEMFFGNTFKATEGSREEREPKDD